MYAVGDFSSSPVAYFFTWDMFPAHRSESVQRIAIGQTAAGKYVRLHPSPWDQDRGGVRGDLTRVDLERGGLYYRPAVEQDLSRAAPQHVNDPIVRVYLFEQYWPAKFNLPDDLYSAWAGEKKPAAQGQTAFEKSWRTSWRLREKFDVSSAPAMPTVSGAAP